MVKYYEGDILPIEKTVFVFGSNPEGRHGAGAAKVALDSFGAVYGQGEGLQGNAYAIPTKDLRISENNSLRSIPPEAITESIRKMYECARENPDKRFMVAYRNTDTQSLNGYTGLEMIKMFLDAGPVPENVYVSEEWMQTGLFGEKEAVEGKEAAEGPQRLHGIPANRAELFGKAIAAGANQWHLVDGYNILPLSENLYAIQELATNEKGDYIRYRLYNSAGESMHKGFILGSEDSLEQPSPSWTINENGILSADLFNDRRRLDERLDNLSITKGVLLSNEEMLELYTDGREEETTMEKRAVEWFLSLPFVAMQKVFDSSVINLAATKMKEQGPTGQADWERTVDDISTNLHGVWSEGLSEADAMNLYKDLFTSLPNTAQAAIYESAATIGTNVDEQSLSFGEMVSSSYDVTMVGVGTHSLEQVLSMIPQQTDCVYIVNHRQKYSHDMRLNRQRFINVLNRSGLSDVKLYPDWDKDVYSTAADITKDIDAGKRVVCIYTESSPQFGKTSITLGQELSRRGNSVAWQILYKDGQVNTISHEQAILARVHHAHLLSGKVHDIVFEFDKTGKPTGKFHLNEGVTLVLPKHKDRRIIEYNSTRRPSYNGKTRQPIYTNRSYLDNIKEMVRRAEVVLIIGPDIDNDLFLRQARKIAGNKAIPIRIMADPTALRDPEYARRKMAENWALVQANTMWREKNRELFNPSSQKVAVIGSDEMKMLYEHFSLEWQQQAYNERTLRDTEGNDMVFGLSDDEVYLEKNTNTTVPDDTIDDSVRPTGVTTEDEKTFAANLFRAFQENVSMEMLNEEYEKKGLPLPFTENDLWTEKKELTKGALDAKIIRRHGAVLSAPVYSASGEHLNDLTNFDLYQQETIDEETRENRESFLKWKQQMHIDPNSMGLFEGYNKKTYQDYAGTLAVSLDNPGTFRQILAPYLSEGRNIERMDIDALRSLMIETIPILSQDEVMSAISQMSSVISFAALPVEQMYGILAEQDVIAENISLSRTKKGSLQDTAENRHVLSDIFGALPAEGRRELLAAARWNAVQAENSTHEKIADGIFVDSLSEQARREIFSSRGIGKQTWSTFTSGSTFGVRVLHVHEDVYAVQYRKITSELKEEFVYGLYDKDGDSLIDGYIPGSENDCFEFPSPAWTLEPLAESLREMVPSYNHETRSQGIGQVVSNGAPGLNKSALLGAQAEGLPYLPIYAKEFFVPFSLRRDGAPVLVPVRAGKDNYCKTGFMEGKFGHPSYIQVTPNDFTAYLENEYKMYREPRVPVRVTEESVKEALDKFAEKESAMLTPDTDGLKPGLTPAQVLTLRHMGFPNEEVLKMVRVAAALNKPVMGAVGLVELINHCGTRDFVSSGILSEETAVEGYYKTAAGVMENSLRLGEHFVCFQEDEYPSVLKLWDGYSQTLNVKTKSANKEPLVKKQEAPSFLVYKGDISLLDEPTVFVTGSSSSPTSEAIGAARLAGSSLAQEGVAVVAVLRNGTDMHAIRSALDRGGRVVLVSPHALDDPKDAAIIQEVINKGGCVISEVLPGTRFADAREAAIESILGADPEAYTRDSQKEKVINMTSSGFYVNENIVRARHLATVLGKHLMVVETKEIGDDIDRSVIELSSDAQNGVSTFSFAPIDGEISYKHAGNETLIRQYGATAIKTDGTGLDEVIRKAQSLSPNWLQADAEKHETDASVELLYGGGESGKLSTVNFEVVRQGTRQVFVTDSSYIQDAVRNCYGPDAQFASSRKDALGMLYGRPITIFQVEHETFHGWDGIQMQDDVPYVAKLIYHEDFIYSPTSAPAAAFGSRSSEGIRKMHYSFLHDTIFPTADSIILALNEANGFVGNKTPMRYAEGTYIVKHPAGVDVYMGAGQKADQDICIARVYIDSDGLLRFWNAEREYGLDTVQYAKDKVFKMPGIPRADYSEDTIKDFMTNLEEFCLLSSRSEREEYALADRETHEEIERTIEAGYRVVDKEDNLYKLSTNITSSLGRTIALPLAGAKPIDKAIVMAALNRQTNAIVAELNNLRNQDSTIANRINRLSGDLAQLQNDKGSMIIEYEDVITEKRQELMSIGELRDELSTRLVKLELDKRHVAMAEEIYPADHVFTGGEHIEKTKNTDRSLNDIFHTLSVSEQDTLLAASNVYQKEDFAVVLFNSLSKTERRAILSGIGEQMTKKDSGFSYKEKTDYKAVYDFKKKVLKPISDTSLKDAIYNNAFSLLSSIHQRAVMADYMQRKNLDYGKDYFERLDLNTKRAVVSFIEQNREAYNKDALKLYDALPKRMGLSLDGRFLSVSLRPFDGKDLSKSEKAELAEAAKDVITYKEENKAAVDAFMETISRNESPDRILTAAERVAIQKKGLERKLQVKQASEGEIIQFEDKIRRNGVMVKNDGPALPTGVGIAKRADHYAYVRGNEVISDWFMEMTHMPGSQRMLVKTGVDKYNVINSRGKKLLPEDVDEVRMDSERISAVRLNGRWNHVNFKTGGNQYICQDWAVDVHDFHDGRAAIQAGEEEGENKGKWAFIDANGDLFSDWYDRVEDYKDGTAKGYLGDVEYTLNLNGDEIEERNLNEAPDAEKTAPVAAQSDEIDNDIEL